MRILATLQMVIGIAVLGLGAVSSRSRSSRLMLAGGINIALAAYLLLGARSDALRGTALAVLTVLLVVTFATTSRAAWRVLRVELLLAGVLIAGIAASQLVTNIPASGRMGLLAVIATAGILLVALPIARLVKWVRSDLVS